MVGCNSVFHLAALIGIPYSYVSPLAYLRTNVEVSNTGAVLDGDLDQFIEASLKMGL